FPVAVWSWNACLAAICGNATVWKPSHKTPLCALAVQRLCNRVIEAHRLPPIFQLFIDAGTGLATRFVDDRRVALISFTGSTEVGRKVGERVGPLIEAQALESYRSALAAARAAGGELLYGGKVLERSGNFVEPAIVRARNDWPIVQTETFAPILYLIPVASLGEAIGAQNASAHGLSSALFTDRLANAETFLSAGGSDCGIANINLGTSGAEIGGAFGGEKDTGGGRESGSGAWKAYMRRQTNTVNWGRELPLAQGVQVKIDQ